MTLAYPLRLLCLCLAAFFLVHLAVAVMVLAISPAVVRRTERMAPRMAARWLLALRLAPPACALFAIAALCVPSYLLLEPEASVEEVGLACLASALLGSAVWGVSIARAVRAAARSLRHRGPGGQLLSRAPRHQSRPPGRPAPGVSGFPIPYTFW